MVRALVAANAQTVWVKTIDVRPPPPPLPAPPALGLTLRSPAAQVGCLPLHLAAYTGALPESAQAIYEAYPEALAVKDDTVRRPLRRRRPPRDRAPHACSACVRV